MNLKRHLFTKARLNRSVFTPGSMKSWPISLRALLRLGGSKLYNIWPVSSVVLLNRALHVPILYNIRYQNDLICIANSMGSPNEGANSIWMFAFKNRADTSNPYRNSDIIQRFEEFSELIFRFPFFCINIRLVKFYGRSTPTLRLPYSAPTCLSNVCMNVLFP